MPITKKILAPGAFKMEPGLTIGGITVTAFSFGGSTISQLGAGHMLPFKSIQGNVKSDLKEDDSIEGAAFKPLPYQTGIKGEIPLAIDWRFLNMDQLLYWCFGYEDPGTSPVNRTGGIYSHLYELDKNTREISKYEGSEYGGGVVALDRKTRIAVIGRKMGPEDHRWPFAMCKSFAFSSQAGGPLSMTMQGQCFREDRGSYNSAAWTMPTGVPGADNMALHQHLTLSIGPVGSLATLAVTDLNISVDIPIFIDQDSQSGLYIAEPVLNGRYEPKISFTIARHSVDTWLAYRDSFSDLAMKAVWTKGSYELGLYLPSVRVSNSQVTEDDVSRNTVELVAGYPTGANPFSTEISTHSLKQVGPLFCMTKNTSSQNEMRRY